MIGYPLFPAIFVLVFTTVVANNKSLCGSPQQAPASRPDFRQILEKIASFSPDPCGPPYQVVRDSADLESSAFSRAANFVTDQLNATDGNLDLPDERLVAALKSLERVSDEVNASWPKEARFRFEILTLTPLFVVNMGLRTTETFYVFGASGRKSAKRNEVWQNAGSEESSPEYAANTLLGLYPLQRGPSRHPRFLASYSYVGCAGSTGVAYRGYEWDPQSIGSLQKIISQAGNFGLDDKVKGFPQTGKLRTEGSLIALPYCWFSPIDTWDNPSLCAVDSYDVSGDKIRFQSRTYNRPDLVPIAKAIEFAEQRDYRAVLGYCSSSAVARTLVSDIPPGLFAEDVRTTRTGPNKERVELGYPITYRFDVEKRAGHWQVVGFSTR